jgi:hypothetical protein
MDNLIATKLNCKVTELKNFLVKPSILEEINKLFFGMRIYTLYKNRNKEYKEFPFHYITTRGSNQLMAYGGKCQVKVYQHYYSRHRININFPQNPCVVHSFNNQKYYYPLELVSVVRYHVPTYFGFKSLKELTPRHFMRQTDYEEYVLREKTKLNGKVIDFQAIKNAVDLKTLQKLQTRCPTNIDATKDGNIPIINFQI